KGEINRKTAVRKTVVEEDVKKKGVALRKKSVGNVASRSADVILDLVVPAPGTYVLTAKSVPLDRVALQKTDTTGMLTLKSWFQLGASRRTQRIVFDSFKGETQELGKFDFSDTHEKLRIWLPANLL